MSGLSGLPVHDLHSKSLTKASQLGVEPLLWEKQGIKSQALYPFVASKAFVLGCYYRILENKTPEEAEPEDQWKFFPYDSPCSSVLLLIKHDYVTLHSVLSDRHAWCLPLHDPLTNCLCDFHLHYNSNVLISHHLWIWTPSYQDFRGPTHGRKLEHISVGAYTFYESFIWKNLSICHDWLISQDPGTSHFIQLFPMF